MPFIDELVARLPEPVRRLAMQHHELIKFALVGGTTFVFDLVIFYALTFTVLEPKPVVARIISGTLATILSYILNREWAFKNRGGRERHHEALLFFAISGIGVILAAAPLWVANNVFELRSNVTTTELVVLDFVLGFLIGNLLQMAFRFWALRKFAFPVEQLRGGDAGSTDLHPSDAELIDEELGHA
ncbi:GtrA family protein [Gordonia sp. Z-3]|uniref:GtrA family protein n=1 Tax=unclassified Gordonia (in: high G+C Gram-positive bacteria) TaxID=2657482 RepID=UPI000C3DF554|nr:MULTISPECIES: GtrA family protein [unclassified Gordonia (in: high G+C Gram-positive bacteria)]MAU83236.1 sugar translocase [Gordonia sp. (in: high G+C Gram-positive bacteria)]MED5801332.1 GtrA family protein [Gordonia sp. Z-3]